jgi:hypothetical protein
MEQSNRRLPWSGAPDSVRCTREPKSELATFGNSGSRSAIIHRTVQRQRSNGYTTPTVFCNETVKVYSARMRAQKSEQRQKAHQIVNSDCPVHHRTVRWPRSQKLQRSNPNGRVTWLAHRTVSRGAPDCPVRHTTTAFTNGYFGGWGYKYPQPPTIHGIQVFSLQSSYKSYSIQYKTQNKEIKSSPKSGITPTKLVTRERERHLCSFELLRLDCFSSSFFLVFKSLVIKTRDTKLWWSL